MNNSLVIDPNFFFWDKVDYDNDFTKYKTIVLELTVLLELIERDRSSILLSIESTKLILESFPANDISGDMGILFRRFIASAGHRFQHYPNFVFDAILTKPHLINFLLSKDIQYEVKRLFSEVLESSEEVVFLSNNAFCSSNKSLKISNYKKSREINCISFLEDIVDYLERSKRRYEEHTKHDPVIGWGSPLHADRRAVEEMLFKAEKAPKGNSFALYYYYQSNSSFIIFRPHRENKYHAYEVTDSNEVPSSIKTKLSYLFAVGKVKKVVKGK